MKKLILIIALAASACGGRETEEVPSSEPTLAPEAVMCQDTRLANTDDDRCYLGQKIVDPDTGECQCWREYTGCWNFCKIQYYTSSFYWSSQTLECFCYPEN